MYFTSNQVKDIATYQVDRMNQEVQVNQYMVSKLLGKGAQGIVRMASDTKKIYALKIINCQKLRKKYFVKAHELKQMISVESKLLSKLNHQNVIKFYEALYSEQYEKLCIVLEFCSKGSLHQLISSDKVPQNWDQKVRYITRQTVQGLAYLHHNSIVHRDIKSQNILIAEKQIVKYCDFNISSKTQRVQEMNVGFQGTKLYAPPELLIMTNNVVSPYSTDIWSLGMTILQLATRKHPFGDKTIQQLQESVKNQIQIPDTIDQQLKKLLRGMLNLDWRKRPNIKQILSHPYILNDIVPF